MILNVDSVNNIVFHMVVELLIPAKGQLLRHLYFAAMQSPVGSYNINMASLDKLSKEQVSKPRFANQQCDLTEFSCCVCCFCLFV